MQVICDIELTVQVMLYRVNCAAAVQDAAAGGCQSMRHAPKRVTVRMARRGAAPCVAARGTASRDCQ